MLKYKYKINEEITRWVTEVYINSNPDKNWYISFTNPTAGPWKRMTVKNIYGKSIEIKKFPREEKRPDLVLINDKKKEILIIEAKYDLADLLSDEQMIKSVKVVVDMANELKNIAVKEWETRKKYKVITSFLWYCSNPLNSLAESKLVNKKYHENITKGLSRETVNIIIYKKNEVLTNLFITENKIHNDIDKI